jgi:hypothetical protein
MDASLPGVHMDCYSVLHLLLGIGKGTYRRKAVVVIPRVASPIGMTLKVIPFRQYVIDYIEFLKQTQLMGITDIVNVLKYPRLVFDIQ